MLEVKIAVVFITTRGQYPAIFMTSLISVENLFYDLFLNNLIFLAGSTQY